LVRPGRLGATSAPTAAAQWCSAAFATGGVPSSVNTSASPSDATASGRLKRACVNGFVSPHG
jgi:hypothetical protein